MPKVDYRSLAEGIVANVGGETNIDSATHCATRLRLRLKDEGRADQSAVEKLPGVITVIRAAGQFQVVIGDDVPLVHGELQRFLTFGGDTVTAKSKAKGNVLTQFMNLVAAIFTPFLWTLAGAGLFKAVLTAASSWGWLSAESQTYVILNAAADAAFYFLPMFLAITAAKHFQANQFVSLAIAGSLLYPSIVAFAATGDPVMFAGIPVIIVTYTSSVIPIIVAVWLQSYLERFLNKVLPSIIRNFINPLLTLLIMVPLVLTTVGPITTFVGDGMASGVQSLFATAPWLAGAVQGGLGQVFVLFGLHWAFTPIYFSEMANSGYTLLYAPLMAAVMAQAAACLAVLLRSQSHTRRELAGSAAFSAFLAGITEPAIYGVNLPLKKPFYFGIAGGAVGGAIIATAGNAVVAPVFPSLLGLPAYTQVGTVAGMFLGMATAIVIGFVLTFIFVDRESAGAVTVPVPAEDHESSTLDDAFPAVNGVSAVGDAGTRTAVLSRTVDVLTPVTGRVVPLSAVPDAAFSSRALGEGLGVRPTEGRIYAPVSGKVMAAIQTGHAYGIKTPEGVEVLVHIGIGTVNLKGEGFRAAVQKGQEVEAGDLLAEVDLDLITSAGYDAITLVVVTNTTDLTAVTPVGDKTLTYGSRAISVKV